MKSILVTLVRRVIERLKPLHRAKLYWIRYSDFQWPRDLDKCISIYQSALPHGLLLLDPVSRAHHLHSLGDALRTRYLQTYDSNDIEEASVVLREAFEIIMDLPEVLGDYSEYVTDYARALELEAQKAYTPRCRARTRPLPDLGSSNLSSNLREFESLAQYSWSQFSLARSDHLTYILAVGRGDLDWSISLQKKVLAHAELTEDRHEQAMGAFRLGLSLWSQFERNKEAETLDECITMLQTASEQGGFPLNALATAVFARFFSNPQDSDRDIAVNSIVNDLQDTTHSRARQLNRASHWVSFFHQNPSIRDALNPAMRTKILWYFGEAVSLREGLDVYASRTAEQRLRRIRQSAHIASEIASHAAELNETQMAIEWIERGRSVFWKDSANIPEPSHYMVKIKPSPPMPFPELLKASERGPVIMLLESGRDVHAVLLRHPLKPEETIRLHNVDFSTLRKWISFLDNARSEGKRSTFGDDGQTPRPRQSRLKLKAAKNQPATYEETLASLWHFIVQPIVSLLDLKKGLGLRRPRIWWCTSGSFTFLPLHAAGVYTGNSPECLADYAISSYTHDLSTLICARQQPLPEKNHPGLKMCVFTKSRACGLPVLQNVAQELEVIKRLVPVSIFSHISSEGGDHSHRETTGREDGTLQHLPDTLIPTMKNQADATLVHFACHATQDPESPLMSHFRVLDTKMTLESMMKHHYPNAYFAFLSACESAMGDEAFSDDAIHLASVMLFLGFRSVIGTMWSMYDLDGPLVAKHVYGSLFKDGHLITDPDVIPLALDAAVQDLRQSGIPAVRWATYVHIGI